MSWLYSAALVAEYLAATSSDGAPFAPSNGNPTPQAFCAHDKMTAFSRLSRFGMTCAPLTENHGAALLTWYLAGFHARTSVQPERGGGSRPADQDCGKKWPESSVKYCLDSYSWKTHRCLWDEALPWSSVTLPRWGMTRTGVVYQHPTSERPISATVSGLWPTPTTQDNIQTSGQFTEKTGTTLGYAARFWPTPSATDGQRSGVMTDSMTGQSLTQVVNTEARKSFPTPTRWDYKGPNGPDGLIRKDGKSRMDQLPNVVGGQLNPTWVEWLMGWPQGWTDLKPLEMDKFREWQRQHGEF